MCSIRVKVVHTFDEDTKQFLRELFKPASEPTGPPAHIEGFSINLEGIEPMFIVKDDQADVPYAISLGKVTDAEGVEITDANVLASLKKTFESTDPTVVSVIATDALSGSLHFGAPGSASVVANVTTKDDVLLATGAKDFTVTVGDPAKVDNIGIAITGLTEEPEPPPVEPSARRR